jgi:uncharacterized membrane protein HdeD (DUF308 family)
MAQILALNWWALALRGAVAIIFGLIAFLMPGVTLYALTILFGAYALIDGIVSLLAAFRSARQGEHWWTLLFEGVMGLGAAAVTAAWPGVTLVVLVFIIAAWAVVTGVFEIIAAMRLRRFISGEWLLVLAGIASILFGVLLFAAPATGAIVLAWWLGAYIFVFGILTLGLAFRLRRWSGSLRPETARGTLTS